MPRDSPSLIGINRKSHQILRDDVDVEYCHEDGSISSPGLRGVVLEDGAILVRILSRRKRFGRKKFRTNWPGFVVAAEGA